MIASRCRPGARWRFGLDSFRRHGLATAHSHLRAEETSQIVKKRAYFPKWSIGHNTTGSETPLTTEVDKKGRTGGLTSMTPCG